MAIIRTSGIVTAITGSIGGQTFVTGKRGTVARIRGYRRAGHSENMLQQRAFFERVTASWRARSVEERNAWRDLARTYPRTNRLGQTSPLSGYQLYIKIVLKRGGDNHSLHTFLPFLAPAAVLTDMTTTCIGTNEPTVFVTTDSPNPVSSVYIYGARNLSTIQPKFIKNWRLIFNTVVPDGGPEQIFWGDRWNDKIGDLLTNETYAIRATAFEIVNEITEKPGILAFGQQQD